jgi:ABC-type oligopeptide transport system substrate-binding subunit
MKYALVCKNEPREKGYRVAEIVDTLLSYEPSPDHIWVECADDLKADAKWFDPNDNTFKDFLSFPNQVVADGQPTTSGTQII